MVEYNVCFLKRKIFVWNNDIVKLCFSATAQVQVMIADKNDNAPYFIQDLWEISVPEQMPDSSGSILTVTARDKDEGMWKQSY